MRHWAARPILGLHISVTSLSDLHAIRLTATSGSQSQLLEVAAGDIFAFSDQRKPEPSASTTPSERLRLVGALQQVIRRYSHPRPFTLRRLLRPNPSMVEKTFGSWKTADLERSVYFGRERCSCSLYPIYFSM